MNIDLPVFLALLVPGLKALVVVLGANTTGGKLALLLQHAAEAFQSPAAEGPAMPAHALGVRPMATVAFTSHPAELTTGALLDWADSHPPVQVRATTLEARPAPMRPQPL